MQNELYHYGVVGMKWGIRRNLRRSDAFQRSRKDVKDSHKKYWKAETDYQHEIRKSGADFDKKHPHNPNASRSDMLEREVDRYVHVMNKSQAAKQRRDTAGNQYKRFVADTVKQYGDALVRDVKVSEKQRQKIDQVIRDELVKDIWSDD